MGKKYNQLIIETKEWTTHLDLPLLQPYEIKISLLSEGEVEKKEVKKFAIICPPENAEVIVISERD
ncbi:hypothetical protein KKF82_08335 [Patescibacteria group bacterium]|nr:hypothetical protein [Patescibacteria group bacterium]